MTTQVEPLIRRNIFTSEEEAIQELVRDYIVRQLEILQNEIHQFERKYGMNFQQFHQYLHERSALLEKKALPMKRLQALNMAVMQEEDDWLDWKAARELLENWLGLRQEAGA
jgi:recombinational DNA repair ATPase RecF